MEHIALMPIADRALTVLFVRLSEVGFSAPQVAIEHRLTREPFPRRLPTAGLLRDAWPITKLAFVFTCAVFAERLNFGEA